MDRILVVDDDEVVRYEVVRFLKKVTGLNIASAKSGNEVIRLLESGKRFDVIVSDYNMPDGSGATIVEYLEQNNIQIAFIFYTAAIKIELPPSSFIDVRVVEKFDLAYLGELVIQTLCIGPAKKK
jgi:CheY-like chemotaxis protein